MFFYEIANFNFNSILYIPTPNVYYLFEVLLKQCALKNPFEKDGFLDHRFHFLGKVVTALALPT